MSAKELQEIICPKFTEQVLFDIVYKKSGLSGVKVNKIIIGAESKKGDSYLSNVCRFTIKATGTNSVGQEETVSIPVIVKFMPKNVARRKTFRCADFFENEIIFYTKVWTAFQKFQDSKKINERFDNIPLVLSSYIDGTNDYIAISDLSIEGYKSVERGTGLNREHTSVILKLLAQFHAISLAMKDQQPEVFDAAGSSLKETYFAEKCRQWYGGYMQTILTVVRDAVEKELPLLYLKKFDNLISDDLFGKLCKLCKLRGPLAVVTHGDVWVPNFLLKYSKTGSIDHIAMIDFQLTRYTSLANDLTFFLYLCVDFDLLEQNWEELVAEYHKALGDGLEKFGSSRKLVTLKALHEEIKATNAFAIGMCMEGFCMSLLEDDEVGDLDAIQGEEAVPVETVCVLHPRKEQEKRQRIANMIKFAVDKNFI